jgi:hypothetical protein
MKIEFFLNLDRYNNDYLFRRAQGKMVIILDLANCLVQVS